jgi:hypothetical protein
VGDDDEKKKKDRDWVTPLIMGVIFIPVAGGALWEACGSHVYGTTPADLEAVSLEGTPKQLGKALSWTSVSSSSVRATFRVGPGKPYRYAEFSWSSKEPNAPYSMRLVPHSEGHEEEEHGAQVLAAFTRRFHAASDGSWQWGTASIHVHSNDGAAELNVEPSSRKKPNPLFDRQMDAARQVILEAAFGIPVRASDADLSELLGAPYHTADVGKIDPSMTIENVPAAMKTRFPGALHEYSDRWEIAVDQPLLRSVVLSWTNHRAGTLSTVTFDVTTAYETSRDLLESCIATKVGPPTTKITDYAADKKNFVFAIGPLYLVLERSGIDLSAPTGWDAAAFAQVFDTLGGCKDKSENSGARGDGRKK